jgi:hypothetical protein
MRPEGIEVHRCGNLGDFLEQFLKEGAREEVVGLGQDARELRIVLLDVTYGVVDRLATSVASGSARSWS